MKIFGKEIEIGIKGIVVTMIVGAFGTGIGWVTTTLWENTSFHKSEKAVEKLLQEHKEYKDSVNIYLGEHNTRLILIEKHITKEIEQKSFAVGLRYNEEENKMYYRTSDKKEREVHKGNTGDYYRDENDRIVYINDKY